MQQNGRFGGSLYEHDLCPFGIRCTFFIGGQVLCIAFDLLCAGEDAAEQIAAVAAGFIQCHRIRFSFRSVVITADQRTGDAAGLAGFPGLQRDACRSTAYSASHKVIRQRLSFYQTGNKALQSLLLEFLIDLFSISSFRDVLRSGCSDKRKMFLLGFRSGLCRCGARAVFQKPHKGLVPVNDIFQQPGAAEFLIIPDRKAAFGTRRRVQDQNGKLGGVGQLQAVSMDRPIELPRNGLGGGSFL